MMSLIMVVLSIGLMAAALAITVNYLPQWQNTAADTSAMLQHSFSDLRGGFSSAWVADNVNSYKTGIYTDPSTTAAADGGLSADFSSYMFTPAAPAGYAWLYGHSSANGLSYFCMYPTGSGATLGVYHGMREASMAFGANQGEIVLTNGGAAACGSTADSGMPAGYPADYVLTLFVHCAVTPSPDYSTNGQVACTLQ